MRRIYVFIVILFLTGMTVFGEAVDMSLYIQEYNRSDATVFDLRNILRAVRDENLTGIGDFYHNAVRRFVQRLSSFSSNQERVAVEETASLLIRGIAAEKHTASATYIWNLVQYFDIASLRNDGILMYEALFAMGEIEAKQYASHLAALLETYNQRTTSDAIVKSRTQRVVPGAIHALEVLSEPVGIRPVFFASIGWYDPEVKAMAATALVNMMDALGEVINNIVSSIITDPFNSTQVKNIAWQELLRTDVPNNIKAQVAVIALEASFITTSRDAEPIAREMRLSAIEIIRVMGVEDDSVYAFLERSYREAFHAPATDFEKIILVVRTLSAIRTDEAVHLLTEFLRELHSRRRSGPWGTVERDIMAIIIPAIANTGTRYRPTIQLLTVMQASPIYTFAEQSWARNALSVLANQ